MAQRRPVGSARNSHLRTSPAAARSPGVAAATPQSQARPSLCSLVPPTEQSRETPSWACPGTRPGRSVGSRPPPAWPEGCRWSGAGRGRGRPAALTPRAAAPPRPRGATRLGGRRHGSRLVQRRHVDDAPAPGAPSGLEPHVGIAGATAGHHAVDARGGRAGGRPERWDVGAEPEPSRRGSPGDGQPVRRAVPSRIGEVAVADRDRPEPDGQVAGGPLQLGRPAGGRGGRRRGDRLGGQDRGEDEQGHNEPSDPVTCRDPGHGALP